MIKNSRACPLVSTPGRTSFHVLVIRTWNERLDHLTRDNRGYVRAIALASEFLQDQGKALVGLRGPKAKRHKVLEQKLTALVLKHLEVSTTVNFPAEGGIHVLSEYFGEVVPPAVDACVHLGRKDILFGQVGSLAHRVQ